jgi:hypothetical protein
VSLVSKRRPRIDYDHLMKVAHERGYSRVALEFDPSGRVRFTASVAGEAGETNGKNPWDEVLIDEAQQKRPS